MSIHDHYYYYYSIAEAIQCSHVLCGTIYLPVASLLSFSFIHQWSTQSPFDVSIWNFVPPLMNFFDHETTDAQDGVLRRVSQQIFHVKYKEYAE